MAQVMNFWRWPEKGYGVMSYYDKRSGQTIEADFGNSTYDWGNMLADYYAGTPTTAQKQAVAVLMRDAGASVQMNYSLGGSAAIVSNVGKALNGYFRYSSNAQVRFRNNMTGNEWEDLLRSELRAGRPVIYGGSKPSGGGHAFVCDGYDDAGYFHFNWGWGGDLDGWFLTSSLDPYGSASDAYNLSQTIVVGIQPDRNWNPQDNTPHTSFSWNLDEATGTLYVYGSLSSTPWSSQRKQIKKVVLGAGIPEIPREFFKDYTALEEVVFGEGLTAIYPYAFAYTKLQAVDFPSTLTAIYGYAFYDTPLENVLISSGLQTLDGAFMGCKKLASYTVDLRNATFATEDGVLYNNNLTTLVACPPSRGDGFTIPTSVTTIGKGAFSGCHMTEFAVPDAITTIGETAFSSCNELQRFVLGNGVTTVPSRMCMSCPALTQVVLGENVSMLGYDVFAHTAVTTIYCLAKYAPSLESDTFRNMPENGRVIVPTDAQRYNREWPRRLPKGWTIEYADLSSIQQRIADAECAADDTILYDLSGRQVVNPTPGIYIVNGRKHLVK